MDCNGSFSKEMLNKAELFDLMVTNLPLGLLAVNEDGIIIEFNPAAEKITGYSKSEVVGKKCLEIFKGALCHECCPLKGGKPNSKSSTLQQEAVLIHKDGHKVPIILTAALLKDDNGRTRGGLEMFSDITEHKKMEKHQRVLISMFAHDLKAPIAVAGAFLVRLLKGKAGPLNEKQKEYLGAIDKEIKRLDGYIRSFLDILRMEAGQIPLSLESCSIDKTIYEIAELFKFQAAKKHIKIEIDIPENLPLLMADKDQLQRVMTNLIDNALKYSPKNSTVTIKVTETDESIVCQVKDSGPGIRPEDLPFIFDPFYRGHGKSGEESQKPGSGIGLAVVKSIVEAHGGKVWVESKPGEGASFFFSIPKRSPLVKEI